MMGAFLCRAETSVSCEWSSLSLSRSLPQPRSWGRWAKASAGSAACARRWSASPSWVRTCRPRPAAFLPLLPAFPLQTCPSTCPGTKTAQQECHQALQCQLRAVTGAQRARASWPRAVWETSPPPQDVFTCLRVLRGPRISPRVLPTPAVSALLLTGPQMLLFPPFPVFLAAPQRLRMDEPVLGPGAPSDPLVQLCRRVEGPALIPLILGGDTCHF